MTMVELAQPMTTTRAIASVAYDTAWLAMIPHPLHPSQPRYPAALNWISNNQCLDGSWGSAIKYEHDRILCTLAALIPLVKYGRREKDRQQVARGERYLWQHSHLLRTEADQLVGFELLLPTLMRMATQVGVQVPPYLDMYTEQRARKLSMIPPELIYSSRVTTAHSLEFLGADVDASRLLNAQYPNGSIGNSPAATAFMLQHIDDPAGVAYLEDRFTGDGGVPVLDPCETFEGIWIAYNLFLGGRAAADVLSSEFTASLLDAVRHGGVSMSPSFPIADADDTAVAILLLHEAGYAVDIEMLRQFERDQYFVSYPYEGHPSTGVNIHILSALMHVPGYRQRDQALRKIVRFLRQSRHFGGYWFDKWHISPYYATSHAIVALSELMDEMAEEASSLIEDAAQWIIHTQYENGSWGYWGVPTTEETAYAILALRHLPASAARDAAIATGLSYLDAHQMAVRPALWIGKCLYYPPRIVDAAIVSMLK
jgi:halimadienyl-diphosphate synthase